MNADQVTKPLDAKPQRRKEDPYQILEDNLAAFFFLRVKRFEDDCI
jgi:hypothetical protein